MHKKKYLFFGMFILIFFLIGIVFSFTDNPIILKKGKNIVVFDIEEFFYADSLIKLNPEIEVISFNYLDGSKGYLNVFGGLGENFQIQNREYEIIVNKEIKLVLPK